MYKTNEATSTPVLDMEALFMSLTQVRKSIRMAQSPNGAGFSAQHCVVDGLQEKWCFGYCTAPEILLQYSSCDETTVYGRVFSIALIPVSSYSNALPF